MHTPPEAGLCCVVRTSEGRAPVVTNPWSCEKRVPVCAMWRMCAAETGANSWCDPPRVCSPPRSHPLESEAGRVPR